MTLSPRTTGTAAAEGTSADSWSPEEVSTLARAVTRAPSVHNTQPWKLSFRRRTVTLWERGESGLDGHDPERRDLRISCGAALANLTLAVRASGWKTDVDRGGPAQRPGSLASVCAARREQPSAIDLMQYQAIPRRESWRRPFRHVPVSDMEQAVVADAASWPGAQARWIMDDEQAHAVAELLSHSSRVFRDDRRYQRELSAWTYSTPSAHGVSDGRGIPDGALPRQGVSAIGLAASRTQVPDCAMLASRIGREAVLVLGSSGDGRGDHLLAGEAMQQAWLAATSMGLAVSVMTQPLHLSEVRSGLRDALRMDGVPQVVLRMGYPAAVPEARSPRRDVGEIFTD